MHAISRFVFLQEATDMKLHLENFFSDRYFTYIFEIFLLTTAVIFFYNQLKLKNGYVYRNIRDNPR